MIDFTDTTNVLLTRIADALDRAYPPVSHPPVAYLFDDPKVDPVIFIMETWGETRENAEKVVATTRAQDTDQPATWHGVKVIN
jgi:hypothetical protein